MRLMVQFLFILWTVLASSGCAYMWGPNQRQLPEGHKKVFVKLFENRTQEVGVETELTNAFVEELGRMGVGEVTDEEHADMILKGTIYTIDYLGLSPVLIPNSSLTLFSEYQTRITIVVRAVDKSDREIWQGQFLGEKNYKAPQITESSLRTANPLYNQSARRQALRIIARDLSSEAVARLTENF